MKTQNINPQLIARLARYKANAQKSLEAMRKNHPNADGWRVFNVPFSYGYGSHPEHEAFRILSEKGFFTGEYYDIRDKIRFIDCGYGLKRDLYQGIYF